MSPRPSVPEIFLVALRLGCTSFGGPVAHLAHFRREYVERRRWLDEAQFADLVALCQFLPGPASSQTGFGVGYLQRGLPGGLAAWLGFTLPSTLLMLAAAAGFTALGPSTGSGWLLGLKAAAVAAVAQAVVQMSRTLTPDWPRQALAIVVAAVLLLDPFAGTQIAAIAAGALVGWLLLPDRGTAEAPKPGSDAVVLPPFRASAIYLGLFFTLLLALPVLARLTGHPAIEIFDRLYRTGSLVFGGGHVVLPLLEREVVGPGWVSHDQFLAGYGAAQALPGPLFCFSAYLGAVSHHGPGGVAGGLLALGAVFLPALLLVAGALPSWQRLRSRPAAQAALRGANTAVVGLLLAALMHPVATAGVPDLRSGALAAATFALLQFTRLPAWAVVALAAAAGAVLPWG